MIILVAAMSHGRVIGKDGGLPWGHGNMKHDQARFRQLVDNQLIVIGSGTFDPHDDYIKNAKRVYLLTTQDMPKTAKVTPISSLQPILKLAKLHDVFVVGGAGVFAQFMPHADKLELTYIHADYDGTKFFPEFAESDWQLVNETSHPADKDNIHPYKFLTLIKK